MSERVSDADLEGVISFYESEYRHNRSVYAPDIEVVMPPELLLAREVRELRQLARDVAAREPLDCDGEFNTCDCIYCRSFCDGDAGDPPITHAESCPYRRAVELTSAHTIAHEPGDDDAAGES